MAPDPRVPANILGKKVPRRELSKGEALLAARRLHGSEIELRVTRLRLRLGSRIRVMIGSSLVLAIDNDCQFVTTDARSVHKLAQKWRTGFRRSDSRGKISVALLRYCDRLQAGCAVP
jgi:hypothetical protein